MVNQRTRCYIPGGQGRGTRRPSAKCRCPRETACSKVNGQRSNEGQVNVKITRQLVPQLTQVHEAVHHLGHAKAMAEVVERRRIVDPRGTIDR